MNKNQFFEVQKEVINKVFEFEDLKRREYLAQYKYITIFNEYIIEQAKLKYENIYMLEGIKAKSEKQEFDVNAKKEELENKLAVYIRNYEIAKQVLNVYDSYTEENIQLLNETYKDFVSKYHPAINVKASEEQVQIYQMLTSVYLVGKVDAFINMYQEAKNVLNEIEIEDDFDEILNAYNQTISNLTPLLEKRKQSLPLMYEEIINDEFKITNEISRFREAIYELRNINKNLRLDWQLNYNSEF